MLVNGGTASHFQLLSLDHGLSDCVVDLPVLRTSTYISQYTDGKQLQSFLLCVDAPFSKSLRYLTQG